MYRKQDQLGRYFTQLIDEVNSEPTLDTKQKIRLELLDELNNELLNYSYVEQ